MRGLKGDENIPSDRAESSSLLILDEECSSATEIETA